MVPKDENFGKLEHLVLDENKIVTTKMLSCELEIHISEAQQYMLDFYKLQKSKSNASLYALYFIAGIIEKDGGKAIKISIATEDKLEEAKKSFIEISSCHIHSLSKRKQLDECSLYNAENIYFRNAAKCNRSCTIKHPNVKRQLPTLTKNTASVMSTENTTNQKIELSKSNNIVSAAEKSITEKEEMTENKISFQGKKSNEKPNILISLWKGRENKTMECKAEDCKSEGKPKNAICGSSKNLPKNNIINMFSRQTGKNTTACKKDDPIPNEKKANCLKGENVDQQKDSSTAKGDLKQNITSKKQALPQKTVKQVSKKKREADSEDEFKSQKRKHRRICVLDDSESDSESEEAQDHAQCNILNITSDENPFPSVLHTEDEEPIPPTPPSVNQSGIKRIWKNVSKTYQDEDGFFVTKQEKELVSILDDNEDNSPPKPTVAKHSMQKSTVLNKKQASLTSYFSRK